MGAIVILEKLYLKNFTAFRNMRIEFSPGINIIIGDNGAGKTHLLKVLYSICRAESGKTEFDAAEKWFVNELALCFGLSDARQLPSPGELFHSLNDEMIIDLDYRGGRFRFEAEISENGETEFQLSRDEAHGELFSAVYIPSREMLSLAGIEKLIEERNLPFDVTHTDVLSMTSRAELEYISGESRRLLGKIADMINGGVVYQNERYYIERGGRMIDIKLEGEGYKKLAVIWRLIETGALRDGTILFWDEPESNVNPRHIADIVEVIIALGRMGVQIFATSHDYFFSKYLDVKRTEAEVVLYHAFYRSDGEVKVETETAFDLLDNNDIISETIRLYDEEIRKVLG